MNTIVTIPMPGDVAELIGFTAEKVENRSLLLDKFVFHKKWPVVEEQTRRGRDFVKWNEASRWSFMRIADGAEQILKREGAAKRARANGNNVEPANRERYLAEAKIAETLARVKWDSKELNELRASHTRRFLGLFRKAYGKLSVVTIGQLEGRLAINLADSLIQNAGICLDRLFGLPYIPGSAIKGVARHAALAELKSASGENRRNLFKQVVAIFGCAKNDFAPAKPAKKPGGKATPAGDFFPYLDLSEERDQKGAIAFLPAYPLNEAKIVVDLTNVHYPLYYGGDKRKNIQAGQTSSLKTEKPTPNPFPAVEVGAQFAFCLVLNNMSEDLSLLETASRWLRLAITEHGLGAKTASGYGWFSIRDDVLESIEEEERRVAEAAARAEKERKAQEEKRQQEEQRRATMNPEELAAEDLLKLNDEAFANFAKELASKKEVQQRAFIHLLRNNKNKRERWKTWKKRRADLAAGIQQVATKLNLPPLP